MIFIILYHDNLRDKNLQNLKCVPLNVKTANTSLHFMLIVMVVVMVVVDKSRDLLSKPLENIFKINRSFTSGLDFWGTIYKKIPPQKRWEKRD